MLADLARCFGVHPQQITQWKVQLLDRMCVVFDQQVHASPVMDLKSSHAKINEMMLENYLLEGAFSRRMHRSVSHRKRPRWQGIWTSATPCSIYFNEPPQLLMA